MGGSPDKDRDAEKRMKREKAELLAEKRDEESRLAKKRFLFSQEAQMPLLNTSERGIVTAGRALMGQTPKGAT